MNLTNNRVDCLTIYDPLTNQLPSHEWKRAIERFLVYNADTLTRTHPLRSLTITNDTGQGFTLYWPSREADLFYPDCFATGMIVEPELTLDLGESFVLRVGSNHLEVEAALFRLVHGYYQMVVLDLSAKSDYLAQALKVVGITEIRLWTTGRRDGLHFSTR